MSRAAPPIDAPGSAELSRLRERVQQLEQQNADLQLQVSRAPTEPPTAPAPVVDEPPQAEHAGPAFADERQADVLARLDWQAMGAVTNEDGADAGRTCQGARAARRAAEQHVMFPEGATADDGISLFHSSLFTRPCVDPEREPLLWGSRAADRACAHGRDADDLRRVDVTCAASNGPA